MKVKNIMFSGFAAAILMGVAAEASAAPVAVASKGYVDSVAGALGNLRTTDKANLVEAINELKDDKLDQVQAAGEALTAGEYYSSITQTTNGQVTVEKDTLATAIRADEMKAPTTMAVYEAIQGVGGQIGGLDLLPGAGGEGKYVKFVKQEDGQVSAEEGTIDAELSRTSNNPVTNAAVTTELAGKQDMLILGDNLSYGEGGKLDAKDTTYTADGYVNISDTNVITVSGLQPTITDGADVTATNGFISEVKQDNGTVTATATAFDTEITNADNTNMSTAPTSAAVYNAIQGVRAAIPNMPAGCSGEGVTCVLTNEGGVFKWAVLTPTTNDQSWTLPADAVVPEVTQ